MDEKEKKRRGYFGATAFVTAASFSALLNRLGIGTGLHPLWLNVLRLWLSVAFLWPVLLLLRRDELSEWRQAPRRVKLLTLLSGAMLALHFSTWTMALSKIDSVVVASIWSASTLFTVIGASIFLRERTPLAALAGLLLAACGMVVTTLGASASHALGIGYSLLTAVAFSGYTLCGRCVRGKLDSLVYNTLIYTVAAVCVLFCALIGRASPAQIDAGSFLTGLGLCLICTIFGHSMHNYALGFLKAQTVNVISLGEVVTGPLLVFLVLHEVPATRSILGGALIVAGVLAYIIFEERAVARHGSTKTSRFQSR